MPDREKVIKGLHNLRRYIEDKEWSDKTAGAYFETVTEAISVLKEQEPVKPILKREGRNKLYNDYVCPNCDNNIVYEQNYCSECGRAIDWK